MWIDIGKEMKEFFENVWDLFEIGGKMVLFCNIVDNKVKEKKVCDLIY